jgi:DNA-binding LytR/AlgR family response regulator
VKILLKNIIYFESQGNDVKVCLINECIIVSKITISELATNLLHKRFVRIHRSFLVNSAAITAINNNEVLAGKILIPVGRSYKKEFEAFTKIFLTKRYH